MCKCEFCEEEASLKVAIIKEKIKQLRGEFDRLPDKMKFALGSRGVDLLGKIHRLKCEKERLE